MDWENNDDDFEGFDDEDWSDGTDPLGETGPKGKPGQRGVSDYEAARIYVEDVLCPQTCAKAVVLEGLHEACVGIEESGLLVYSWDRMIEVMTEKMLMDYDTAAMWIDDAIVPLRKEGRGFVLIHQTGPGGR